MILVYWRILKSIFYHILKLLKLFINFYPALTIFDTTDLVFIWSWRYDSIDISCTAHFSSCLGSSWVVCISCTYKNHMNCQYYRVFSQVHYMIDRVLSFHQSSLCIGIFDRYLFDCIGPSLWSLAFFFIAHADLFSLFHWNKSCLHFC